MGPGSDDAVSAIADIQRAILVLPEAEFAQLREWISDLDWEKWDRQLEADVRDGRLDFLIAEALEAKEDGALQEL